MRDIKRKNLVGLAAASLVLAGVVGASPAYAADCSAGAAAGVNWSACNKSSWSLSGATLAGANLSGTNLSAADLSGANLAGANLAGANLAGANLTGANLTGANLTGANLTGATATNANFVSAVLAAATLETTSLNASDLTSVVLSGADVQYTDFTGTTLTGITALGLVGSPSNLPTGFGDYSGVLVGPYVNLAGKTLDGIDFSNANFSSANLAGATAIGANLYSVNATGANFIGLNAAAANLSAANLAGINMASAILTNATLNDATLTNTDLSSANLTGATMFNTHVAGTKLTNATLRGVLSDSLSGTPTGLPASYSIVSGYLVGPYVNLSGRYLQAVNLAGLDLSNADFTGANLTGANLTGTNLTDCTMQYVNGYYAQFTGANLTRADLFNANLENATFSAANLTDATLESASMRYTTFTGANLTGANLTNAQPYDSYFVSANLTDANLSGANLSRTNLVLANLTRTNLSGAALNDVTSGSIVGVPSALPSGWYLLDSALVHAGTPGQVPVYDPHVTLTDGVLHLTWAAAVSDGGSPIDSYALTVSPDLSCSVSGRTATCTGFDYGTHYNFSVAAHNVAGYGATRSVTDWWSVAPYGPAHVTVVAGDTTAFVSWTPPRWDGGAYIQSYAVTAMPGEIECPVVDLTATCTGLTNGTAYTFGVVAHNESGDSWASEVVATPSTTPGSPQRAAAQSLRGHRNQITWQAPATTGGAAITAYEYCLGSCANPARWVSVSAGTRSVTARGFVKGRRYTVLLRARNRNGVGSAVAVRFRQTR